LRTRAGQLDTEIAVHEAAVLDSSRTGRPVPPSRPVEVLRILADEFRAVAELADQNEHVAERSRS
jgi:hypothetical protein